MREIEYEKLITEIKQNFQPNEKYRPISFCFGEDLYVVGLWFKNKLQIVCFYDFGKSGYYCYCSIMNFEEEIKIRTHVIDRFIERFPQSQKYSMLELLAKELLFLIDKERNENYYIKTKHGLFSIFERDNDIVVTTWFNEKYMNKKLELNPKENWFIEI